MMITRINNNNTNRIINYLITIFNSNNGGSNFGNIYSSSSMVWYGMVNVDLYSAIVT